MPTPFTIAPKRILIIDDEILVASVLRDVLKHQGYAVELTSGGEAGLKALRRERADLVHAGWGVRLAGQAVRHQ